MVKVNGHNVGLLGADGRPIEREAARDPERRSVIKSILGGLADSFAQAVRNTDAPAAVRARDPFSNHAWVAAAAIITALTAGQAPLQVMREAKPTTERRRELAKSLGRAFVPGVGHQRRAIQRYIDLPVEKRLALKAAEPDLEHPLMDVLLRPNPMQDGAQLLAMTFIWQSVRGEAFWLKTDEDGNAIGPGESPSRLWCIPPDAWEAVLSNGRTGELVGWKYSPPVWMPNSTGSTAAKVAVDLDAVAQFKFPNPYDQVRGLSRIGAAAHGIRLDMMIAGHQSKLLTGNGIPRLALTHKDQFSPEEEAEFMAQWKRTYGGEYGDAVAMLTGGFDLKSIALNPADMELLELAKWDRETILAVMGVPPSKLGVTEFTNYATALSQDFTFWSSTILPMLRMIERTLDGSMMFGETDDAFLLFDLTGIDALRAGMVEKLSAVDKLTADKIHMPPKDAFALVGLEVPEYLGDDLALINSIVSGTVENLLEAPPLLEEPTAPTPGAPPPPTKPADAPPATEPKPEDPPAETPPQTPKGESDKTLAAAGRILVYQGPHAKAKAGKRWKEFLKLEVAHEKAMVLAYRKWVGKERKSTLERFDSLSGKQLRSVLDQLRAKSGIAVVKDANIDLTAVLPDPDESGNDLKGKTRPVRTSAMQETFEFTGDEIGIPTFEIDDPKLHRYFDLRERKFVDKTPKTIIQNLRSTLTEGFQKSETVTQLRSRVAQVYDVAASSAKAATVARTETANFMNGVRDQMFELQGFEEEDWVTAGDENVRDSHVVYGAAGPKPRDFNYLTLSGGGAGRLRFPGDIEAPAYEVVNCRCMKVAIG